MSAPGGPEGDARYKVEGKLTLSVTKALNLDLALPATEDEEVAPASDRAYWVDTAGEVAV